MAALVLPIWIAASLLGCGGSDAGQLRLAVGGGQPADKYEVRVFGPVVTCAAFEKAPETLRTGRHCDPSETAEDCHLLMAVVADGPVRIIPVPTGRITVTILGLAGQTLVTYGCADDVLVEERTTATVRVAMRAK